MTKAKTVLQKISDRIAIAFTFRINVELPTNLYIIYEGFVLQPYPLFDQWCVNTQQLKTLE